MCEISATNSKSLKPQHTTHEDSPQTKPDTFRFRRPNEARQAPQGRQTSAAASFTRIIQLRPRDQSIDEAKIEHTPSD